ncbi:MaoC family dehydratase [Pseudomonas sp. RL_15y_Pfl2_60]|uniref:MaoC family dehydratase n=1 Tax=Pseudomonas sp. RL_15y_Pfl2_60 TaxID=3088709 RepID=UPI0030DA9667
MTIQWHDLDTVSAHPGLYLQAVLRRNVTGKVLPDLGLRAQITIDPHNLAGYRKVCGIVESSLLPPAYPHVLAFPLQLRLLTDKRFPFPLLGLVHLENSIQVLRPLAGLGPFTISVHAENLKPHEKGAVFSIITRLEDQLGLLWQGDSRILCRGVKLDASPETAQEFENMQLSELAHWHAPSDIGRRYARVSGDYNPIHMSALSAKLFGFPRAIAHGLWNKGRVLAELADQLPDSGYQVYVRFKKPLLLPGDVTLKASANAPSGQFMLSGSNDVPHLQGKWQPLETI